MILFMNQCSFIQINDLYQCKNCKYTTKYKNLHRECRPLQIPSLPQRLSNFTQAALNHQLAGSPKCTEEQIKARLKICEGCELFKLADNGIGGVCTHSSCGCNIKDTVEYFNKLAWADQKCPIDKWGQIEVNKIEIRESGVYTSRGD